MRTMPPGVQIILITTIAGYLLQISPNRRNISMAKLNPYRGAPHKGILCPWIHTLRELAGRCYACHSGLMYGNAHDPQVSRGTINLLTPAIRESCYTNEAD
jgi:hypothetical protein